MCACILALVIRHAKRIFSTLYYIVISGLSGSIIFYHITSQMARIWRGFLSTKSVFWIYLQLFVSKVSCSRKNGTRYYHKCL